MDEAQTLRLVRELAQNWSDSLLSLSSAMDAIAAAVLTPAPAPEPPEPRRIRLQVTGDQAQVTVAGGPLAPGRYVGTVVKLTLRREQVA